MLVAAFMGFSNKRALALRLTLLMVSTPKENGVHFASWNHIGITLQGIKKGTGKPQSYISHTYVLTMCKQQ